MRFYPTQAQECRAIPPSFAGATLGGPDGARHVLRIVIATFPAKRLLFRSYDMKKLVALLVLVVATAHAQVPAKRAFALSDWYRVTTVRQPAMSPDGKWIAFTVTTVLEAQNKRLSEVWVVPSAGGAVTRLTPAGVESTTPRWAPDGKTVVVTSGGGLQRYRADNFAVAPERVDRFQDGSV